MSPESYSHKQSAPLCFLLYAMVVLPFVIAWQGEDTAAYAISGSLSLVLLYLAASFHYLAVSDRGDRLQIAYGPMPLFWRSVAYHNIERVEISRTSLTDGWGIHLSLRGGWVWNIWGRDCVGVQFHNGGKLWIGSDDAENLARFLEERIRQ